MARLQKRVPPRRFLLKFQLSMGSIVNWHCSVAKEVPQKEIPVEMRCCGYSLQYGSTK